MFSCQGLKNFIKPLCTLFRSCRNQATIMVIQPGVVYSETRVVLEIYRSCNCRIEGKQRFGRKSITTNSAPPISDRYQVPDDYVV